MRVMAAETLLRTGCHPQTPAIQVLVQSCADGPAPPALAIQALNAVDDLGWVGLEVILMLPQEEGSQPEKSRNHGDYRKRLLERFTSKMRKQ